jgi:hypothetical protein
LPRLLYGVLESALDIYARDYAYVPIFNAGCNSTKVQSICTTQLKASSAFSLFTDSSYTTQARFTGNFTVDGPRIALCFNSDDIVSLWTYFKQGFAEAGFRSSLWQPCVSPPAIASVTCGFSGPSLPVYLTNLKTDGSRFYCFSAESIATLSDGARIILRDLKQWDRVLVSLPDGAVSTSSVFFVQHTPRTRASRVVLQVSTAGGHALHVTAQHFLPISAGGCGAAATYAQTAMTPAHRVRVGDGVWTTLGPATGGLAGTPSSLVCSSVQAIAATPVSAVLNPLTFSGTIIVDGVAASAYSLFIDEAALGAANVRYVPAVLHLLSLPARAVIAVMRHLPQPLSKVLIAAVLRWGELLDDDALAPAPVRSALGIASGIAVLASILWAVALLVLSLARALHAKLALPDLEAKKEGGIHATRGSNGVWC